MLFLPIQGIPSPQPHYISASPFHQKDGSVQNIAEIHVIDNLLFVLSFRVGYEKSLVNISSLNFQIRKFPMNYPRKDLDKILLDHSVWVLSKGRSGNLANLKNSGLDGANLEMANLPFAEMQSASLKGAYLQGANFRKANLMQAKLSGARLDGADFEGANLSEADLRFSVCAGANFTDANLKGSDFVGSNLEHVNFKGADLRGANFKNAKLLFVDMREANLDNANFEGANLNEANFEGANLKGVNFEKTIYQISELSGAIYSGSTANGLKLLETGFTDLDLNNLITKSGEPVKTTKEDLSVDSIAINQDVIEAAFRELIDKIKSHINDDQIKTICAEQYGIDSIDKIDFEQGNIVTYGDHVSIKLDFKISHTISLLIDRKGNHRIVPSSHDTI